MNGGLCAEVCHEGTIGIVNGKATLLRVDYCDGLDQEDYSEKLTQIIEENDSSTSNHNIH